MEVRPSEFRIDAVVSAQCDMVQALTEEKNIDLEVHVRATSMPLFQDQAKVQQIPGGKRLYPYRCKSLQP